MDRGSRTPAKWFTSNGLATRNRSKLLADNLLRWSPCTRIWYLRYSCNMATEFRASDSLAVNSSRRIVYLQLGFSPSCMYSSSDFWAFLAGFLAGILVAGFSASLAARRSRRISLAFF